MIEIEFSRYKDKVASDIRKQEIMKKIKQDQRFATHFSSV